jgi:hypothetical protein
MCSKGKVWSMLNEHNTCEKQAAAGVEMSTPAPTTAIHKKLSGTKFIEHVN